MKKLNYYRSFALAMSLLLTACNNDSGPARDTVPEQAEDTSLTAWVDRKRLLTADDEPHNWLSSGRDFMQQQYSPLQQINDLNVAQLGMAWEYRINPTHGRVLHAMEATPQVIDGIMYTSGPWGSVYAVNAKTGQEVWQYHPKIDPAWARRICCGVVNRGLAVWKGSIYVATLDGFLVSLDAKTGKKNWRVDTFINRKSHYSITSAPWIAGDKVIIGNSGGEKGVRGYISAYDSDSGEFSWRFYTVPGDPKKGFEHPEMELAAKTWSADSHWESGGGGTVWGHMAYDPELNLLYVGVGNASPYPIWYRSPGGGDNLFIASILAINPDTGRLAWHYQTTPGDIWDYTATQHMILADLEIKGRPRQVLMQAPKNGFFYVLDRKTGELLSAKNYVRVNWASHIDLKTGRPVLTGLGNYQNQPKVVLPGPWGGHNWMPMSFSPSAGLVYIPAIDTATMYAGKDTYEYNPFGFNLGADLILPPFPDKYKEYEQGFETETRQEMLMAWNPLKQQEVWRVPLQGFLNGGVLSTAGNLVFQGTSTGSFIAYNAMTGNELKEFDVGTGIMAAPMSFAINGTQYIAVMVGYGGSTSAIYPAGTAPYRYQNTGRIIAFKLGGSEVTLPEKAAPLKIPEPPPLRGTSSQWKHGESLFLQYCIACHGATNAEVRSAYPNLMTMHKATHEIFKQIVLDGLFSFGGMASFSDALSQEDVEAIHAYLIQQQHKLKDGKSIPNEARFH